MLANLDEYIEKARQQRKAASFEGRIPILDLNLAINEDTRSSFLEKLKEALLNIGFFYIVNPPFLECSTLGAITEEGWKFFDLPKEEKLKIEMANSKHFLGYNDMGDELTAKHLDWREQIDLATELPSPNIKNEDEIWKNLEGPNLWPDEKLVPNFRPVVESYIAQLTLLSKLLVGLIGDALGLNAEALKPYFKENQQCKMKIIRYPDLSQHKDNVNLIEEKFSNSLVDFSQGVGEHRDNDFLTIIYQASNQTALQVQDFNGNWIDIPPLSDTLVVNVGQTLEYITNGTCVATIHRVLTPLPGDGDRLSIAFFQNVDISSYKSKVSIPKDIKDEVEARDKWRTQNEISFQFPHLESKPIGHSVFLNRIKSHPKVGERWYPEILKSVRETQR